MIDPTGGERTATFLSRPRWLTKAAFAFAYWAAFLLVLEPGNVLRAARAGHALALDHEVARIPAAAALGTTVMPLLLLLLHRFPLHGPQCWRRVLVHLGSAVLMAFGLNVVASLLDAWFFQGQVLPTLAAIRDQLVGNLLLVSYAIVALIAILHVVSARHNKEKDSATAQARPAERISVRTRGRAHFVEIASVDWIETQGNYVALHVGASTHLVRETAARITAQLDSDRFVRIHRRAIIAVDRVLNIKRLANGDALVTLVNGEEIRASRRYRKSLWEKWEDRPAVT